MCVCACRPAGLLCARRIYCVVYASGIYCAPQRVFQRDLCASGITHNLGIFGLANIPKNAWHASQERVVFFFVVSATIWGPELYGTKIRTRRVLRENSSRLMTAVSK